MSAEYGGYAKDGVPPNGQPTTHQIERINTAEVYGESPAHNEKLYLDPEHPVAGQLRRTFANPTPVALAGFLMCTCPASKQIMGWRGAGGVSGDAAATTADYYLFGGILFILGGVGEFILGNTFTCCIFNTFGAFWFTFGGTLSKIQRFWLLNHSANLLEAPYYNAVNAYTDASSFYAGFAYFLIVSGNSPSNLCQCFNVPTSH